MSTSSHQAIIDSGVTELVSFVVRQLDVRFALLRFADGRVIASDPHAPLPFAPEIPRHTAGRAEPVIFVAPQDLAMAPGMTFCAVAPLRAADDSRELGQLIVLDPRIRRLSWPEHKILVQIAAQCARLIELGGIADALLTDGHEYVRALTEDASDVVAIFDPAGVMTYVTPSVQRMLGYAPEELLGTEYRTLVHPDDRERTDQAFRDLVASPDVPAPYAAYRFRAKNGTWRVLESVGRNLQEHPSVHGVVLNSRDITERRELESEVAQLHRLTSLGRLSAQVAHEFNNVLMGIQPFAELIRRRASDELVARAAESMFTAIARGKRITTEILRYSRPAELSLQTVPVAELLQTVGHEIEPLLPRSVTLQLDVAESPMYLSADAAQLSQVLINLALNARDAMRTTGGGTLRITARPTGGFVHLTVADRGEGIADEDLAYIFEPLFTTKPTGTGLGLSVVWQIVTTHGGRISVDSERGRGTAFHIHLPALARPETSDAAPSATSAHPGSLRVLIVEDDEAVAGGLQMSLEAEGMDVAVARNAAELLPRLGEHRPDVVILDLSLPDDTGCNLYARTPELARLPVLFSSGQAVDCNVEELLRRPRTAFLMKPYATRELLQTIHDLVEGGR